VFARRDGGALQFDSYSVVLASGTGGLISSGGVALDGNADGVAGDSYQSSIVNSEPKGGAAALPDFFSAPGLPVSTGPEASDGLPVTLTSEGGVRTIAFVVSYDPALLRIDGARAGIGLPAGAEIRLEPLAAERRQRTAAGGGPQRDADRRPARSSWSCWMRRRLPPPHMEHAKR
jgi:hypothetical protein